MIVSKLPLPEDSRLWTHFGQSDFLDCYAVEAATSPRAAAEIITAFPGWAQGLLQVRKWLTAPFGLRQVGPETGTETGLETGDRVGPFPVHSETEKEVIAGFDDKHLDFRVSVMARGGVVTLATWVHPHNIGGRIYLTAIMPFHILIARDALARVARAA